MTCFGHYVHFQPIRTLEYSWWWVIISLLFLTVDNLNVFLWKRLRFGWKLSQLCNADSEGLSAASQSLHTWREKNKLFIFVLFTPSKHLIQPTHTQSHTHVYKMMLWFKLSLTIRKFSGRIIDSSSSENPSTPPENRNKLIPWKQHVIIY